MCEWVAVDSLRLLLERLEGTRFLLLGGDVEAGSYFFYCETGGLSLGVVSNYPVGFVAGEWLSDSLLLVGFNQVVAVINVSKGCVVSQNKLCGVFFEFCRIDSEKMVLAIHELGVLALDFTGIIMWRFDSSDVMEDWSIERGCVELKTMDGVSVRVGLTTGVEL